MLSGYLSAAESAPRRPRSETADIELVRRAQLGSVTAFEKLILPLWPDLYRYMVFRLRDDGDALDALQETLLAAWRSLPTLKEPGRFWPWLVAIAAHKSADAMRHRAPSAAVNLAAEGREDPNVLEIRDAISALPDHHRQVLLLRYALELTEEEVAEVLHLRVGTVKSRSARARKALMELLR